MTTSPGDVHDIVSDALDGTTIYSLLDSIKTLTSRTGHHNAILATALPSLPETDSQILGLEEQQRDLKEELQKSLALAQAYKMLDMMKETEESVDDSIENANESVDDSVDSTLYAGGYSRQGKQYKRSVIIDSSVFGGIEMEDHKIEAYKYYTAPAFNHGVDLSINTLEKLNSVLIQARVNKARENMNRYLTIIFGPQKDKEADNGTGLDKEFLAHLKAQEDAFKASAQYNKSYTDENDVVQDVGKHTKTIGLFNYYVGYGPEMREDKPEKVKTEGYGEMGRIYKDFSIQQARLYRGLATVNTPTYNQKLWDDDADNDGSSDGFIGAPTIRSVTDIAVSITASAFLGPGAALMVGMMDDALFTALDVQNGTDAGQAWGSFGKKAVVSAAGYGIGAASSGLDSSQLLTFGDTAAGQFGEVVTDTALAGASTAANTYSSAAIQAFEGDSFNWNTFNTMTSWDNTSTSYISSMAGAGVTSTMDLASFGYINETKANFSALSGLAGGLTSSAIQYGMTGETTLNVMNFGMFGIEGKNGLVQSGLLELNLGGDRSLLNVGTGGTDVSVGALQKAMAGMEVFKQNKAIRQSGVDRQLYAGMRTLYSAEMNETSALYDDIINGDAAFTTGKGQDYDGYTTVGSDGKRIIDLNMDGKGSLDLAVLMSHEAFRDGVDSGEFGQQEETMKAALAHMSIGATLAQTYGMNSLNGFNQKEANAYLTAVSTGDWSEVDQALGGYDSSADYWKLIENPDGSLTLNDDGRGGVFYDDENGEEHEIGHFVGGSRTEHLQKILGLELSPEEKSRLNNEMLVAQGSAETFRDGHFLDDEGDHISINLSGEWSDRMGAALDYDRMFVDAWRNDGNMDSILDQMRMMNVAEQYGAKPTDREKYLSDMLSSTTDFSNRFEAGTATEHLFSQMEIEKEAGFGTNALCYATVPVNLYQLRDPSISLDMIGDALKTANDNRLIRDDGLVKEYDSYLKLLGTEFNSSQYLGKGSDFSSLESYLNSDYTMADVGIYGKNKGEQHHYMYRNGYDPIDPFPNQLSWSDINSYRYRTLSWMDF